MAYIDWKLRVNRLQSCSCDWGCPCEVMLPPSRGHCEGTEAYEIVSGHFGETRLDGLLFAFVFRFPGAVHEGGGEALAIVDERANDAQREVLFKIFDGEEQEPTTTFNIYGSVIDVVHDPIFATISFEWDMENLSGGFSVPGVMEAKFEPIRNPVTGAIHHAILKLKEGFDFREAILNSADYWAKGAMQMEGEKRFGYFTHACYGPYGVIEEESYPLAGC